MIVFSVCYSRVPGLNTILFPMLIFSMQLTDCTLILMPVFERSYIVATVLF